MGGFWGSGSSHVCPWAEATVARRGRVVCEGAAPWADGDVWGWPDGDVPAVLNFGQMTSVMLVRSCLAVHDDAGEACAVLSWPDTLSMPGLPGLL